MSAPKKSTLSIINLVGLWLMGFLIVGGCIGLIAMGKGEALAEAVLMIMAVVFCLCVA